MLVMLNRLKTSPMSWSFCSLNSTKVLVTRRSSELKSRPNFRVGFTGDRISLPGFVVGFGGGPLALHGEGDGTATVPVGREFQRAIAAFNWAPFEISRPRALRGRMGSRELRVGTRESIGKWEAMVQMGEMLMFQGTS